MDINSQIADLFPYIQTVEISWQSALWAAVIFLFFLLLRKLFTKYIIRLILSFANRTKTDLDNIAVMAFEKPIQVFFIIIGLYLALQELGYQPVPGHFCAPVVQVLLYIVADLGIMEPDRQFFHVDRRGFEKVELGY